MRNYDRVAWFYDPLSRLVFGGAQVRAQQYLLSFIKSGDRVLVAGGGTGWILEEIARLYPGGLTITYADQSERMIARARKRDAGNNTVHFVCGDVTSVSYEGPYDAVMTPFLFDNLTEGDMRRACAAMDASLGPNGQWLYCDFEETPKRAHRLLLRTMYLFFGVLTGIRARKLPPVGAWLEGHNYYIAAQASFYGGFISSIVYQKQSK